MTRFIQVNHCEVTQLDNEWIILNTANYTITKLNAAGGICWSLLRESQSLASLTQAMNKIYESTENSLNRDMEEFLSELTQCGLIENEK